MALIEVATLEKTFEFDGVATRVLKGITFGIEKGEFVAIMGPSGSGKSTLLHILGLLDDITRGTYFFDGQSVEQMDELAQAAFRNQRMGFVFQAFNLLSRISVMDNVKLPLAYSKVPEKTWNNVAFQSLQAVGLEHRIDYQPTRLSGGERQRAAIARALVNNPEVIFADEPTGNLDSKSGEHVMGILDGLNKKLKHTIILVTHDVNIAKYAHRVIKIKDGQIESDKHH
ncbi:MAG: Macrolide-specific efflux protein MacB [Parcubacteria group bacterium GW2011_GWA2_47_8]|nr:MAG: Macrolide-specific efflux protein MacB [Parcubacteria group bacterium GW2011_GWA2_47_8]OHB20875.1 MAG: macrolide ABC transporter ATP-binding protein [Parcubacteria group bacterium RIFCSPHIGHO2_01_FULL_47_10b]